MNQMNSRSDANIQNIETNRTGESLSGEPLVRMTGIRRPSDFERFGPEINESPASILYGCDQNWYRDPFQQKAGCGPCAAANLIDYAGRPQALAQDPLVKGASAMPDFVHLMHEVWTFVTPGLMGVHRARHLAEGLDRYAREHQLHLASVLLDVPVRRSRRPSDQSVIAFITDGLNVDSPVAFLNRSNGVLKEPESWHWVTIMALYRHTDGSVFAEIANYGVKSRINLSSWLRTTRLGGGFVYCRHDPGK